MNKCIRLPSQIIFPAGYKLSKFDKALNTGAPEDLAALPPEQQELIQSIVHNFKQQMKHLRAR